MDLGRDGGRGRMPSMLVLGLLLVAIVIRASLCS